MKIKSRFYAVVAIMVTSIAATLYAMGLAYVSVGEESLIIPLGCLIALIVCAIAELHEIAKRKEEYTCKD